MKISSTTKLKIPAGQLGAFEILPHSIVGYMQQHGHQVAIIESPMTGGVLLNVHPALAGMYALYDNGVQANGYHKTMRDPRLSDLDNNARMFLVVKFAQQNLMHYVLARKGAPPNQNQCYIMNPDPGTDEPVNFPMVGTFIRTNVGNHVGGGERRYKFLGIAVRVW